MSATARPRRTVALVATAVALATGAVLVVARETRREARAVQARTATGAGPALAPDRTGIRLDEPRSGLEGGLSSARHALSDATPARPEPDTPVAAAHPFLPPDLEVLARGIPERIEAFDQARSTERLHLARELQSLSIAVLLSAQGRGPVPEGAPDDGNLSFTGQGGRWSFQLNDRTYHFHDHDFPEYAEYIPLLGSVYDEEMVLVSTDVELPERLTESIRRRAFEALSWL